MTLRDELIEVAGKAIEAAIDPTSFGWMTGDDGTMHLEGKVNRNEIATAALDAILARLKEPGEEMLAATFATLEGYSNELEPASNFRAMLATVSKAGVGG